MTKRTMIHRLLVVAVIVATCQGALSQTLRPVPPSTNRVLRYSSAGVHNRQKATRLVRAEESEIQLPADSNSSAPSAEDLARRREEKQQHYRQIIDRLRTLQKQLEKAKQAEAAGSDAQPSGSAEPPTQSNDSELADLPVAETSRPNADILKESQLPAPSLPDPANSSDSVESRRLEPGFAEQVLEDIDLSSDVLVDGPVDQIGLADNLYRVKEYELALDIYSQVDVRKLSDEKQFWVQFQTAACHRQLGDLAAARTQLRIIAGQPESGWLGRSSRWWLDTLRDREELEKQMSAMQELISMKMEASNDPK